MDTNSSSDIDIIKLRISQIIRDKHNLYYRNNPSPIDLYWSKAYKTYLEYIRKENITIITLNRYLIFFESFEIIKDDVIKYILRYNQIRKGNKNRSGMKSNSELVWKHINTLCYLCESFVLLNKNISEDDTYYSTSVISHKFRYINIFKMRCGFNRYIKKHSSFCE